MNQPVVLHVLGVKRLGFAFGATATLLYLGCVFVTLTVPRPAVVAFFNSLLHGWDVQPLMRWDLPWWEAAMGLVEVLPPRLARRSGLRGVLQPRRASRPPRLTSTKASSPMRDHSLDGNPAAGSSTRRADPKQTERAAAPAATFAAPRG